MCCSGHRLYGSMIRGDKRGEGERATGLLNETQTGPTNNESPTSFIKGLLSLGVSQPQKPKITEFWGQDYLRNASVRCDRITQQKIQIPGGVRPKSALWSGVGFVSLTPKLADFISDQMGPKPEKNTGLYDKPRGARDSP